MADLRIEAPIPGKAAVGIEVPNKENTAVMLRDLLESKEFKASESPITFAVGKDIAGKVVVADIAKMPHLLVAGATGSGKSVCINTLIMSIIYKADPDSVKLILVDPKVVELSVYNGIPHLMIPVVTDPKKAAGALNWAVAEMEKRYKLFAEYNVRDLKGFNAKVEKGETGEEIKKKLPQIVIIIDELADLMMVAPGEVEGAICRLAQLARAAGLHLVVATQRPSVNVITGLIKANMPSRIAFSVTSGVDSRTIIDMNGAEKLLGKGDMLFYPSGYPKPVRVQGSFVSDKEVQDVVDYLINNNANASYNDELEEHMNTNMPVPGTAPGHESADDKDTYFKAADWLGTKYGGAFKERILDYGEFIQKAVEAVHSNEHYISIGPTLREDYREVVKAIGEDYKRQNVDRISASINRSYETVYQWETEHGIPKEQRLTRDDGHIGQILLRDPHTLAEVRQREDEINRGIAPEIGKKKNRSR